MKNYCILILTVFLSFSQVFSIELTGEGYGKDKDLARKSALSSLSASIEIQVSSQFESMISELSGSSTGGKSLTEEYVKEVIRTKSDLPILGAVYKSLPMEFKNYKEQASISSENVLTLYQTKLVQINNEIDKGVSLLKSAKNSTEKEVVLNNMLTNLNEFKKYFIVAVTLGMDNIPKIGITEAEIKLEIAKLSENYDTIDKAAKKITSDINYQDIYVMPPVTNVSDEITQFGRVIKDNISKYLKTVDRPDKAKYLFKGKYEILNEGNDGIELKYELLSNNSEKKTLSVKILKLQKQSYIDYKFIPDTINIDSIIKDKDNPIFVSNDFKIEITTNKGRDALLFTQGESVEIFIKVNKQSYVYAIEHITNQNVSYLLEVYSENQDKDKFIRLIPADEVNKWISMGEFEVVAPFGSERLQFFASNDRVSLKNAIANYYLEDSTELYRIGEKTDEEVDVEEVVTKSRGLAKKGKKENKIEMVENFLPFTTME